MVNSLAINYYSNTQRFYKYIHTSGKNTYLRNKTRTTHDGTLAAVWTE